MVLISYFVWGDMACMDRGVRLPLPTHCLFASIIYFEGHG